MKIARLFNSRVRGATLFGALLIMGCTTPGGTTISPWIPPGSTIKKPGIGAQIEIPWPGEPRNPPPNPGNSSWNEWFNQNNIEEIGSDTDLTPLTTPAAPDGYNSWDDWYSTGY